MPRINPKNLSSSSIANDRVESAIISEDNAKLVSFTRKNVRATRREGIVSARNLKRRVLKGAWRRTGNLLIVSSFVTKRATVFKYSVNGIYRGERNFSTETGAASNLRKLSRNKFCIHPRDTFHSRRLPRTRGGEGGNTYSVSRFVTVPWPVANSIYPNCDLSIVN